MIAAAIRYRAEAGIALIEIDDGKSNALSLELLRQLNAALDRALSDRSIVILTGRESVFSAGFDLKLLRHGGIDALRMLHAGYSITARLMAFPYPIIAACNGHALAMGVFLMLSSDYVVGVEGDFKLSANEVAIGLPMPRVAAAVLRQRLTPSAFQRAVTLARYFTASEGLDAGFFDEIVKPSALRDRARAVAAELSVLDMRAHAISKQRIRRSTIRRIRSSIPLDLLDATRMGLRALLHGGVRDPNLRR